MTSSTFYPKVTLWNNSIPSSERLQILNPQDFPLQELLKELGIGQSNLKESFGVTDPAEIQGRQELFEFLADHPEICELIRNISPSPIPTGGDAWLSYYSSEHNPHWQNVLRLIQALESLGTSLPPRLRKFLSVLQEKVGEESVERELGKKISEELSKVTSVEGVLEFQWDMTTNTLGSSRIRDHVHGFRNFSTSLAKFKAPKRRLFSLRYLITLGIGWIVHHLWYLSRVLKKRSILRRMVISSLGHFEREEIKDWVENTLRRARLTSKINGMNEMGITTAAQVSVYFVYGQKGLEVRILSVRPIVSRPFGLQSSSFRYKEFDGFSRREQKEIETAESGVLQVVTNSFGMVVESRLRAALLQSDREVFNQQIIPSKQFDLAYRWFAVGEALGSPAFREQVDRVRAHREFFYDHVFTLQEVVFLVRQMTEAAKSRGASLCYGEIPAESESILMDGVFPMHLALECKPIPLTGIEPINGKPVGLLGNNGGGKSTAQLTFAVIIYLNQSGLPFLGVRGARFSSPLVRTLALSFIERAAMGSTCEKLLLKMEAILEHLEKKGGKGTVVIADEIGSGTDPQEVMPMAKNFLAKVKASGSSFIFSTQIQELAVFAKTELFAHCYQFARDHSISPGVGTPDPVGLARAKGFTRLMTPHT